jgi:hypothetical protein
MNIKIPVSSGYMEVRNVRVDPDSKETDTHTQKKQTPSSSFVAASLARSGVLRRYHRCHMATLQSFKNKTDIKAVCIRPLAAKRTEQSRKSRKKSKIINGMLWVKTLKMLYRIK